MEYIQSKLWEHVEKSNTKIAKKVYDVLNSDTFSVVLDKDIFWFEKTWSGAVIPNFCYQYTVKFYKKLGYTYLYEN